MKIALVGVRGVPALYSGFETAATEIFVRLAERGHDVTVYCRDGYGDQTQPEYKGVKKKYLPRLKLRIGDTLSHTFLSIIDTCRNPPDVLIVFNPANGPLCLLSRAFGIPFAINVDGLEWKRSKWPWIGRKYFYFACWVSAKITPWIIADSRKIAQIYQEWWGRECFYATYGGYVSRSADPSLISPHGVEPGKYFILVARLEPENNPDLIVEAFMKVKTDKKLLVVGGTAYPSKFLQNLMASCKDERVLFPGGIYDQAVLNELLCDSFAYIHGHCVGGTNPILLQVMGAGTLILYIDDEYGFNREVVGDAGLPFPRSVDGLAAVMQDMVDNPEAGTIYRKRAQPRLASHYTWDAVADQYEQLCFAMLEKPEAVQAT